MKKNLLIITILLSLPKEIPLLLFGVLPIRGPCAWVLDVWTLEFEFDKRPSDVCVAIPCESETHKKERLVFDREYAIATQRKKDPILLFFFFFGFHTGCSSQLTRTSINLHSQLELATSHKLLQLLELELKITPSRTPEFYPVVDKPLNPTWWLKTQNFIQLLT